MRRFLSFAALLGVALVLGCQDLGSGPVGPDGLEPQFAKKDCTAEPTHPGCKDDDGGGEGGDPSYTVTHDVSFLTTDPIRDGRPSLGKEGTSVSIGDALDRKTIVLSEDLVNQLSGSGPIDECSSISYDRQ